MVEVGQMSNRYGLKVGGLYVIGRKGLTTYNSKNYNEKIAPRTIVMLTEMSPCNKWLDTTTVKFLHGKQICEVHIHNENLIYWKDWFTDYD